MSRGQAVTGGGRRAPWALMYHAVGDPADDPYRVTISPARLARQLRWLSRRGLTGVGMHELLAARARGRADRLVGLTFDDGYADFVAHAVPLLREGGHTATVFVLPGRLGGANAWDPLGPRRPLLDADGIRAARAAGMEIGSHGLLHRDLTAADDAVLADETAGSRQLLAEITDVAPPGFCYPYGALDARAVEAVRRAGYAYACAVSPGPLAGPHALPRAYVGERDTALRLHAKRAVHRLKSPRIGPTWPATEEPAPRESHPSGRCTAQDGPPPADPDPPAPDPMCTGHAPAAGDRESVAEHRAAPRPATAVGHAPTAHRSAAATPRGTAPADHDTEPVSPIGTTPPDPDPPTADRRSAAGTADPGRVPAEHRAAGAVPGDGGRSVLPREDS